MRYCILLFAAGLAVFGAHESRAQGGPGSASIEFTPASPSPGQTTQLTLTYTGAFIPISEEPFWTLSTEIDGSQVLFTVPGIRLWAPPIGTFVQSYQFAAPPSGTYDYSVVLVDDNVPPSTIGTIATGTLVVAGGAAYGGPRVITSWGEFALIFSIACLALTGARAIRKG